MINNIALYLIRHGETIQNTKTNLIGQSPDEPLSLLGQIQARTLGNYIHRNIHLDKIFCSTYKRAQDTLKIASEQWNLPIETVLAPELREYSAGEFAGNKRSEVLTESVLDRMNFLGMNYKFPGGESLHEVQQRATWLIHKEILSKPEMEDKSIALFSHGMTIKCILQHILKSDPDLTYRFMIDNCSLTKLRLKDGLWFVDYINNTPVQHAISCGP